MKTGLLDSKKQFHEIPFYEIQGLCEAIVNTAISINKEYKEKYEIYKKNITRFSPEFEFCIHELGWYLYDPFNLGNDEALFSNGRRSYVASMNYINNPEFDRTKIDNENIGYPLLLDSTVNYIKEPKANSNIKEGIVDKKGYVDASFAGTIETLAEIELMFALMKDKEKYEEYTEHKDEYPTKLSYLTSKPNVISAKKLEDGSITISYVSENDGVVQEFIDDIEKNNKLANMDLLVQEECRSMIKAA